MSALKNARARLAFECLCESIFALWLKLKLNRREEAFLRLLSTHLRLLHILQFRGRYLQRRVIIGLYIVYIVWRSLQSYRQGAVHCVPFVKMPALSFHQCEQGLPTATELWSKMLCVMADMPALLHRFGLI